MILEGMSMIALISPEGAFDLMSDWNWVRTGPEIQIPGK
jgi:hypothetical protein